VDGPGREITRLGRANRLVRSGKPAEAVAEADAVARGKNVPGRLLYDAACTHALASGAVAGDAPAQERYAARAVELLAAAFDRGFNDVGKLQKDRELDPLRQRADFKTLVQRVTPKDKP
jgi:hypothetical protein